MFEEPQANRPSSRVDDNLRAATWFFVLACMPTRVNNYGGSVECEKERIFSFVAFTNK